MRKIVFSDVDGTLVNSKKDVLQSSKTAVSILTKKGIPFVIVSARSPSGLYPIQKDLGISCPIISYSGSLMMDEKKNVLWSIGFAPYLAEEIISFLEDKEYPCAWNVYSGDNWYVKDTSNWMVKREEKAVRAFSSQGGPSSLKEGELVSKILVMCDPNRIKEVEAALKGKFKDLSICCSSDILIEIMPKGVSKGDAVKKACEFLGYSVEEAIAFGDNFNDVEMLDTVGTPVLMNNAPAELKERFPNITDDNDSGGIYNYLKRSGIID